MSRQGAREGQGCVLGPAEGYVQVLDGLAGASFYEVIYGAGDYDRAAAVGGGFEVAEVGVGDYGHARVVYKADETLICIGFLIYAPKLGGANRAGGEGVRCG